VSKSTSFFHHRHPGGTIPETLASLMAVGKELGWAPRIFFPNTAISDVKKV
jgi:hypothetical protein